MGLDGVELVMAMEDAFGVNLINDDLSKTVTPRLIGDLIFSKLEATDQRVCQSQRAFHILRKAMMAMFGLKRNDVTLDCKLRDFIPREHEKEVWPQIQKAVDARSWPKLDYPEWVYRVRQGLAVVILAACIFLSVRFGVGWGVGLVLFFLVFVKLNFSGPLKTCIPSRFKTMRDVVPLVMTSDGVKWTREEVSVLVKEIVKEQLGVSEDKYTEDSHFINDFGMD